MIMEARGSIFNIRNLCSCFGGEVTTYLPTFFDLPTYHYFIFKNKLF
jgi:hypothetical protein